MLIGIYEPYDTIHDLPRIQGKPFSPLDIPRFQQDVKSGVFCNCCLGHCMQLGQAIHGFASTYPSGFLYSFKSPKSELVSGGIMKGGNVR